MKKIFLSVFAALFPFISFGYFEDISTTHPNFQAIQWLEKNDIIEGYPVGDTKIFKSTQTISRAETLKILLLSTKSKILAANSIFPDVPNNQWFAPFVTTANNKGIVKGFADGKFYPQAPVTKAELLKMALYAFDAPIDNSFGTETNAEWYVPFIEFGKQYRIIDSVENAIKPLTRGQVAEILFRINQIRKNDFENPYVYSGSGLASYYGPGFHGRPTANGETYDSTQLTAAHRTLPFNTRLKVWLGEDKDKYIIVRINDRGPYHKTRVIDLSEKAFSELAPLSRGVLEVNFELYSEKNSNIEVPAVAKERFSSVAQNISIPEIVQTSLKKKSDYKYITEKKPKEIVSGTRFFNQSVSKLSETFFEKIRFYKDFPQLIRTGTVVNVSGQVADLGHKKITFFFQPKNSNQTAFEFSEPVNGREFSVSIPMTQTGNFKMGVVLDDERTSRVAMIEVRPADYKRTFPLSKKVFSNQLTTVTNPEKKTVRFSWNKENLTDIYQLSFRSQRSNDILKEIFIPSTEKSVTLPYSFFQSFANTQDLLSVDLLQAESADGSLFKQQSNWEKSAYQNYTIVPQFQDTESEEISVIGFTRFLKNKDPLFIYGKKLNKDIHIKKEAYLTLPNKSIVKIPITFDSFENFEFKMLPNDWGTYVLEIVANSGKILFNRAFYVSQEIILPVGKTNTKSVKNTHTTDIYNWINSHRRGVKLSSLEINNELQLFAQKYAEQMAIDDFVGHISPTGVTFEDRIKLANFQGAFSENVAFGSNINLALGGFETSASHFSNILDPQWNQVGIGLVENKKGVYVTQVFGK